jgi:Ser-tRNA(Ala) deacylase AlaX
MTFVKYIFFIMISLGPIRAAEQITRIEEIDKTATNISSITPISTNLSIKSFWQDPYLRKAPVKVVELNGNEVLFNRTIAYHFSGGQESDKATINGLPILSSRMDGFNIRYTLPVEHGLSIGDKAVMEIDWNRRNKLMRYHMLCELVLAITNRHFGNIPKDIELRPEQIDHVGIVKVMARMTDSGAYVDFDHPDFSTHLPTIQSELNRIIDANFPIEKGYLNEEQQERYWKIPGIALIPCGGTHVQSTSEVGRATLKREKTTSKVTATGKAERVKIKLISEALTHPGVVEE